MPTLKLRSVHLSDVEQLVDLINSAYRQKGERAWTSEAEIVQGQRINVQQLQDMLAQENFQLLVGEQDQQIVACIGLTSFGLASLDQGIEIGTFCIAAHLQNQGLGKHLLDYAENYVKQQTQSKGQNLKRMVMWVLNVRAELIAYYQRRGYEPTGSIDDYPIAANVGQPMLDLHLIEMQKRMD